VHLGSFFFLAVSISSHRFSVLVRKDTWDKYLVSWRHWRVTLQFTSLRMEPG
jgi:hypothetical protein